MVDGKTKVKVIAGESLGAKAVIDTRTPIMFLDIHVQAGGTFVQEIPEEYNGFAYVWRGAGSFTEDRHSVEMGKVRKLFCKPYSGKGQSKRKSVLFIHCNCLLSRCVVKKMGQRTTINSFLPDWNRPNMSLACLMSHWLSLR